MDSKVKHIVGYCEKELLLSRPVRTAIRATHMSLDEALDDFKCGKIDRIVAKNNRNNLSLLSAFNMRFEQDYISIVR
jgi:hypothetical protein